MDEEIRPDPGRRIAVEVAMFFLCATGTLALEVFKLVPEPYMDELFHVPQAQRYCGGDFAHWDPMITTLPGLYLSSAAAARPLEWVLGVPATLSCSVLWLRSINVVYSLGNLVALLLLVARLHPGETSGRQLMNAVVLALLPVLYFFSYLYYTDPGSTFFVLLLYLASLHERRYLAAALGVVAILFRQTNVVWVVFVAGVAAARCVEAALRLEKKDITERSHDALDMLPEVLTRLAGMMTNNRRAFVALVRDVLVTCLPYIVVGAGFAAFVVWNGSIVVGAKDDHPAGLHLPQLLYFAAFTCVFSAPHVLSPSALTRFPRALLRRPLAAAALLLLATAAVWRFTAAHRYLLADNRHYTFYVWARVFARHPAVRYALVPGYLFCWWSILRALDARSALWRAVYVLTVAINLVPMTLLEFRYFIVPYLIFRLNIRPPSYLTLAVEGCVYMAVNVATLYLFLYKPFQWPDEQSPQRFMW